MSRWSSSGEHERSRECITMRWLVGVSLGLFSVGVLVGYAARKQGIPPEQVGRWSIKEATRKALDAYDAALDLLPNEAPVTLDAALKALPPAPRAGQEVRA